MRQKSWQHEFLGKTLTERRSFANQARQQSQHATAAKQNAIMDVNKASVEQRLHETGQKLMIHGHTHRPKIHELELDQNKAQRVVLGDWDSNGWFVEIDGQGLRLENFPL